MGQQDHQFDVVMILEKEGRRIASLAPLRTNSNSALRLLQAGKDDLGRSLTLQKIAGTAGIARSFSFLIRRPALDSRSWQTRSPLLVVKHTLAMLRGST